MGVFYDTVLKMRDKGRVLAKKETPKPEVKAATKKHEKKVETVKAVETPIKSAETAVKDIDKRANSKS